MKCSMMLVLALTIARVANAQLDTVWSQKYHESGSDAFKSVIETHNAGYLAVGCHGSHSWPDTSHGWLVRTNEVGDVVWQRTSMDVEHDQYNCIISTSDGGYLAAGVTLRSQDWYRDGHVVKLDAQGNEVWHRSFNQTILCVNSIIETPDGGYLTAGIAHPGGWDAGWLMKVNSEGEIEWERMIGSEVPCIFYSAIPTSDEGYLAAGDSSGSWLVKVDREGNDVWRHEYGGTEFRDVISTSDDGYLAVGNKRAGDYWDGFFVRVDSVGSVVWERVVRGRTWSYLFNVVSIPDDGYMAAGETATSGEPFSEGWLVKLDNDGRYVWQQLIGGIGEDWFFGLIPTSDGGYLTAGYSSTDTSGQGGWLVKFKVHDAGVSPDLLGSPSDFHLAAPCPNPFNSSTTIRFGLDQSSRTELRVYGLDGRLVKELWTGRDEYPTGEHSVVWDASGLSTGIYFVRLQSSSQTATQKVVMVK